MCPGTKKCIGSVQKRECRGRGTDPRRELLANLGKHSGLLLLPAHEMRSGIHHHLRERCASERFSAHFALGSAWHRREATGYEPLEKVTSPWGYGLRLRGAGIWGQEGRGINPTHEMRGGIHHHLRERCASEGFGWSLASWDWCLVLVFGVRCLVSGVWCSAFDA